MQLNPTSHITDFSFWRPVCVSTFEDNPGTPSFAQWAWQVGSLADWYVSWNQEILYVNVTRTNAHKINFQEHLVDVSHPQWLTALKVSSFILSLGILPILSLGTLLSLALTIKIIFKTHLNTVSKDNENIPNKTIFETQIGKTKIVVSSGTITNADADVIVNPATNPKAALLWAGGGVASRIYYHAGDTPFNECREILEHQKQQQLNCGEIILTSAGNLKRGIKAIVHMVEPSATEKRENLEAQLIATYHKSLELILDPKNQEYANFVSPKFNKDLPLRSIAYPPISMGTPQTAKEVASIALKAIKSFIETHPNTVKEVHIVCSPSSPDILQCYKNSSIIEIPMYT